MLTQIVKDLSGKQSLVQCIRDYSNQNIIRGALFKFDYVWSIIFLVLSS